MFCPKCGIEIDEGSVFCSRCGNKLVSTEVTEEKKQTTSSEQETLKRDRNVDVLKPIIIIAAICIAGYFIGMVFQKHLKLRNKTHMSKQMKAVWKPLRKHMGL